MRGATSGFNNQDLNYLSQEVTIHNMELAIPLWTRSERVESPDNGILHRRKSVSACHMRSWRRNHFGPCTRPGTYRIALQMVESKALLNWFVFRERRRHRSYQRKENANAPQICRTSSLVFKCPAAVLGAMILIGAYGLLIGAASLLPVLRAMVK